MKMIFKPSPPDNNMQCDNHHTSRIVGNMKYSKKQDGRGTEFTYNIEKKVKRSLKEHKLREGSTILVIGRLASYLIKKFVHVPVKIIYSTTGNNSDSLNPHIDYKIVEWTLDDECAEFLKDISVLPLNKPSKSPQCQNPPIKVIKILKYIADEDAGAYAKLKGLRFVPREKDKNILDFLAVFNDHPDMKHNLLRNKEEIDSL